MVANTIDSVSLLLSNSCTKGGILLALLQRNKRFVWIIHVILPARIGKDRARDESKRKGLATWLLRATEVNNILPRPRLITHSSQTGPIITSLIHSPQATSTYLAKSIHLLRIHIQYTTYFVCLKVKTTSPTILPGHLRPSICCPGLRESTTAEQNYHLPPPGLTARTA